jgi:autotransporter-associated beta strand protein
MEARISLFAAAIGLLLSVPAAQAGSATWLQNPTNHNWNEPSNWAPATVPHDPADIATFATSNLTSVLISDAGVEGQPLGGIIFNPGASPYTISIIEQQGSCCYSITISGVGIANNSGITQHFVANGADEGHGQFLFTNNATAGTSTVFTSNGSNFPTFQAPPAGVEFRGSSSADHATFINNPAFTLGGHAPQSHPDLPAIVAPGYVAFAENATAAHGMFTNNGGGFDVLGSYTTFVGHSSAADGSFVNNGARAGTSQLSNDGSTIFREFSTAANATFTNNGGLAKTALGGFLGFYDNSTAGTARVTNNNPGAVSGALGGQTGFQINASADRAIIVNEGCVIDQQFGAGETNFRNNATAANSTITNNGGTATDAWGGRTYFFDHATADNATLFANGGSNGGQGAKIQFEEDSTGGTTRIVLAGNGFLTIAPHHAPGVTIGSLEGSGIVFLGNNNLTVGSRNNSTLFSGVIQDGGSLTKIGPGTLTLSGVNTYTGATTANAGKLAVNGSIMSAVTVNSGGTLGGSGTTGSVTVSSGGTGAPGGSQTLHINGNYAQNANGLLKVEVVGTDPNASGRLNITGSATVNGTLVVRFVNGLLPISGQVITVLNVAGAFAGSFAQIIFPDLRAGFQFQAEFVNGTYQITALNGGVAATGFLNISTRMQVGTGENALIGGFIVAGTVPKKVILRAIGPSLAPLPGRLADPTLELRDAAGALILSNDNWMDSQDQEIIDTGIPPSSTLEAAIVATLAPGSYTAVMRGAGNTTGIGVVEVYDLVLNVPARLANISSRGFVETGDNVMIGGFIAGNQATPVIVRAIGPSLAPLGIANALADPTLELHDSSGATIAFNNDWRDNAETAIAATGIPPSDNKESAIVTTLAPGSYTAIVRGLNNTSGVGLVEVYHLQ